MSKKLVQDVALIATKLHEAGLTFEDAQLAAEYCLTEGIRRTGWFSSIGRRLVESPVDILWGGFTWSETPEGHEYWSKLARLLDGVGYEH